jgi:capsule polysaccharide export protein KpsC/LpsZ
MADDHAVVAAPAFERSLKESDVFAFGISSWKIAFLRAYFGQTEFVFTPQYLTDREFRRDWLKRVKAAQKPLFLVWSRKLPEAAANLAANENIPLIYMEDGFLRSMLPSASKTRAISLTLDSKRPYFDARGPSDLEDLISTYDFREDPTLLPRARLAIDQLIESGVSKYNDQSGPDATPLTARASSRRTILVIGQVEDDASILYGHEGPVTNNDLVRLAALENPDCHILYKPHPDVLRKVRKRGSDPRDVASLCDILEDVVPLPTILASVDHVYTITSLAGFEALLRGIPVTTLGLPFYAGWGLTDDRQPSNRRTRRVTVEELFAAAYLLYPLYFNPLTGERISFEACLALMESWLNDGVPPALLERLPNTLERPRDFEFCGAYGIMGWRHAMTPLLAAAISALGTQTDAEDFRRNPIGFFRGLSSPKLRRLGRLLYPFD